SIYYLTVRTTPSPTNAPCRDTTRRNTCHTMHLPNPTYKTRKPVLPRCKGLASPSTKGIQGPTHTHHMRGYSISVQRLDAMNPDQAESRALLSKCFSGFSQANSIESNIREVVRDVSDSDDWLHRPYPVAPPPPLILFLILNSGHQAALGP
ncbi:hypothetical protein B0H14DRAFT_2732070, partial [Mycena olivaceomarginata]